MAALSITQTPIVVNTTLGLANVGRKVSFHDSAKVAVLFATSDYYYSFSNTLAEAAAMGSEATITVKANQPYQLSLEGLNRQGWYMMIGSATASLVVEISTEGA